jgi:hypothetical protein
MKVSAENEKQRVVYAVDQSKPIGLENPPLDTEVRV